MRRRFGGNGGNATMLGAVMIIVGLAVGAWGVMTTLRSPRPLSLVAALGAALGLALALLGMTRLLLPHF
jgi:hypothetical protein